MITTQCTVATSGTERDSTDTNGQQCALANNSGRERTSEQRDHLTRPNSGDPPPRGQGVRGFLYLNQTAMPAAAAAPPPRPAGDDEVRAGRRSGHI